MSPSALRARCPHTCLPFPAGGGAGGRATPLCLGLAPSLRPGPGGCSCERRAGVCRPRRRLLAPRSHGWGLGSALPSGPEPGCCRSLGPRQKNPGPPRPPCGAVRDPPAPRLTTPFTASTHRHLLPLRGACPQSSAHFPRDGSAALVSDGHVGPPAAPMSPRRTVPWTLRSASAGRALADASAGGGTGGGDPGASGGRGTPRRGPLPGGPRARMSQLS